MRCTVTSEVGSSKEILTHFTCKEGKHFINIRFGYLFEKCVFQSSGVLWNLKQMISYVKIADRLDIFIMQKCIKYIHRLVWNVMINKVLCLCFLFVKYMLFTSKALGFLNFPTDC